MRRSGWSGSVSRVCKWAVCALAFCACTEPLARTSITVSIDGDSVVRAATIRVEILVEARLRGTPGGPSTGWETLAQPTFKPNPDADDWPYQFQLDIKDTDRESYSLTATARDRQGAVVARAQTIRTLSEVRRTGLRAHFDTACFRQTELCGDGLTCVAGACIDAASSAAAPDTTDTATAGGASTTSAVMGAPGGIAEPGVRCEVEGERGCVGHGSRTPLRCENATWKTQDECPEAERCDTSEGHRGTCRRISDECMNREPNVTYCDGDVMRVCTDLVASEVRPCSEHERCASGPSGAECKCEPSYVKDETSGVCSEANECGAMNGGCDPQTRCSVTAGERVCGPCLPGYSGTGETGCHPLLKSFGLSAGTPDPAIAPEVTAYRVRVPLLVQRVAFAPEVPPETSLTFNGAAMPATGAWLSPLLKLGETAIEIVATSAFGVSTKYFVTVERSGAQEAYIKADHPDNGDQFGCWIDMSGDTLVVTACREDSASKGTGGDETSNGATDSGAAYVYVRDGGVWKRQAFLKASDTSTGDYFGVRAVIDRDTIVVAGIHENIFSLTTVTAARPGAAYVYTRKDGVWSFSQRIAAMEPNGTDVFGTGLALDGDTLAVGAAWDSASVSRSGAVYIFERRNGTFIQTQKFKSSVPNESAGFGSNVALEGDCLVVGTSNDNEPSPKIGSAEVFVRQGGAWRFMQRLQPPTLTSGTNFGFGVSVHKNRIVVGAPRTPSLFAPQVMTQPGEVYVFDLDGTHWTQTARFGAPFPAESDVFGAFVELTDNFLVIGANGDASGATGVGGDASRTDAPLSGAAYLYVETAEGWVPSTYVKPHNTDRDDAFGYAITTSEDTLVVSACLESGSARGINTTGPATGSTTTGAVYVFR